MADGEDFDAFAGFGREAAKGLTGFLNAKFIDATLLPAEAVKASPDNKIEILIGSKY